MTKRVTKSPAQVRKEAADMARAAARERHATGDPEGAGVLHDLARTIARLRLTERPDDT